MTNKKMFSIGFFSLLVFSILHFNDDYTVPMNRQCEVLDKIQMQGGYKYPGHFYLILRDEKQRTFDLIVTPATFSQSRIGQIITFKIREHDIRQNNTDMNLYIFLKLLSGAVAFLLIIASIICFIIDYKDNKLE